MLFFDAAVHFSCDFVAEKDQQLAYSMNFMNGCYIKAQTMNAEYQASGYGKELNRISDMIKYSDNTAVTGIENTLLEKLTELEHALCAGDHEDIVDKIKEITNIIQTRSIQVKSVKRGSF